MMAEIPELEAVCAIVCTGSGVVGETFGEKLPVSTESAAGLLGISMGGLFGDPFESVGPFETIGCWLKTKLGAMDLRRLACEVS